MDNYGIVIADKTGTIRHWSRGAEIFFGYPAIDAVGQSLDLIVPTEYREQHWYGFHKAIESGTANLDGQSTEIPVLCHDGSIVAFQSAFNLMRNAQKQVIGVMVIFGPRV
ncbi:MAG: PAS domain-containing protein [Aliidongia sp.]